MPTQQYTTNANATLKKWYKVKCTSASYHAWRNEMYLSANWGVAVNSWVCPKIITATSCAHLYQDYKDPVLACSWYYLYYCLESSFLLGSISFVEYLQLPFAIADLTPPPFTGKTQVMGEIKIALKKEMKTDGEQLIVEILQCRNITYKFKSPDHLPGINCKPAF